MTHVAGATAVAALPLDLLGRAGERWILRQRALHRPEARPLGRGERRGMAPFFPEATLDRARVVRTGSLARPRMDQEIAALCLEFARMRGITYADTVVVVDRAAAARLPLPLLFHELVHVVQYRLLGTREFARRYLGGWVEAGFRYGSIPLERTAYALQARFVAGTLAGPVEERVRRDLGALREGGVPAPERERPGDHAPGGPR
jgi:hypothetical protein